MGKVEQPAGNGSNPAPMVPTVSLEQYAEMTDEQKTALPLSRRKKLEKQLVTQRKKQAKAAAAANKPPTNASKKEGAANVDKKKRKSEAQAAADSVMNFVNTTPRGDKKILSDIMAPAYQPRAVEAAWYEWWEERGFFHADANVKKSPEERFVMVIPPPNVTGSLHLGHALMCSVQDALARYHRMLGKEVLWLPGIDHAGIATQAVVEKQLSKLKGVDRHILGRDAFVKEVWKWKEEYGGKIVHQIRRIGSSCDWKREEFTMSEKLSKAVNEAFVKFYDQGLIYRDTRLVNWSSALHTAISEIEVDKIEIEAFTKRKVPGHEKEVEFGVLTKFAYKVDGMGGDEVVVATTRLETMLGDTGVAVHPHDERYKHLIGKFLKHPFVERKIPIIADDVLVNMTFGTGVVKVTPAHDLNDFACGRRNGLPEVTIFDKDGNINDNGGEHFKGMKRYVARVEVERALDDLGLLRGKEPNPMILPVCSRSGDIVEPMLLPQWWMNCKELAKRAVEAARTDELEIVPAQFKDTWYRWLDNIHDWCISRQLWWGHRIPAYKANVIGATDESAWVVGRTENEARERAATRLNVDSAQLVLEQDEDVLDTWFSSGIFPFSVFGWPEHTDDLEAFYPTSLLETGHDILFFWVARMAMMGLGLTGKLPFKTVLLHSLVRDKKGRKMSKSLGNVIDPLEVINGADLKELVNKIKGSNLAPTEVDKAIADQRGDYPNGIPECGADALRIGLLAYMTQGGDINLDVARVIGYRNFCNKLWNATRFALSNLGTNFVYSEEAMQRAISRKGTLNMWILSRMNATSKELNRCFKEFHLGDAVSVAYRFWMSELCGVYLEGLKPVMRGEDEKEKAAARVCLYDCLSQGLRMLHPMMPFVTEELYQRLPGPPAAESICVARYPQYDASRDFVDAEASMEAVMANVVAIRAVKAEYGLKPSSTPSITVMTANAEAAKCVLPRYVQSLAPCGTVTVSVNVGSNEGPAGAAVKVVDDVYEVHVVVAGLIDVEAEIAKLEAGAKEKMIVIADYEKKLGADGYESRVPLKVRERNATAKEKYEAECANLEQLAARFRKLLSHD